MITYKFKLYTSKKNRYLHNQIDLAGEIYNHCIALHKRYYKMYHKYLSCYTLNRHITKLKHLPKYNHWRVLGAQAIQNIVFRIDRAYQLFFRNLRHNIKTSPPNFKKKRTYKSFTLTQTGYKLLDSNKIKLGIQTFKYSKPRYVQGNIKLLTVKRDKLDDIYIYITTDYVKTEVAPLTGNSVGFDFGLKMFLTASDYNDIESPQFFNQNRAAIRRANRNVSHKQRGSNNRYKALLNLERVHKKVVNRRDDFQWKLANELTDNYDTMYFETLDLASMKHRYGRKINDLSFYSFMQKLKYVAVTKGKTVFCIDRYEPSSQTCSVCNYRYRELTIDEREWLCPVCNTQHNRDRNASYNIYRVGASTLAVGNVSPYLWWLPLIAESYIL